MAIVAQDTGLGRESIYKSLSPDGNPEFAIVLKVMRAPWGSGFRPQPLPEQTAISGATSKHSLTALPPLRGQREPKYEQVQSRPHLVAMGNR